MEKNNFLCVLSIAYFSITMFSCSSNVNEQDLAENENPNSQELVLSFDEKEFQANLDNVSALFISNTRSEYLSEEKAREVITPFVEDGKNIKNQLLDDASLSQEQRDSIEILNDNELAILSIIAYSVVKTAEERHITRAYTTNKELNCISSALVGGGSVSGGLTWAFIKRVGIKTAVRLASSVLGGMIGGSITAAMYINDYNTCMNG